MRVKKFKLAGRTSRQQFESWPGLTHWEYEVDWDLERKSKVVGRIGTWVKPMDHRRPKKRKKGATRKKKKSSINGTGAKKKIRNQIQPSLSTGEKQQQTTIKQAVWKKKGAQIRKTR